jgi:hypothetical protein
MIRPALPRIRQPRVAEIVASRLREDILSGCVTIYNCWRRSEPAIPLARFASHRTTLTAARGNTLAFGRDKTIQAKLISREGARR